MKNIKLPLAGKLALILFILVMVFTISCTTAPTTATKTLKMGYVLFLEMPHSLNACQTVETLIDMDNEKGGINIGGEKYKVELLVYDSQGKQDVTVAATNRMVYEDNVKFVMSDPVFADAVYPITEENKVIFSVAMTFFPDLLLGPNNHYTFNGCTIYSSVAALMGWFRESYPQLESCLLVGPDAFFGHLEEEFLRATLIRLGFSPDKIESYFFPEAMVDMSSVGTKIAESNPDWLCVTSENWRAVGAAWEAGYRGQLLSLDSASAAQMSSVIPLEYLEGLIGVADPTEFDPPTTQIARDCKDAYVAKFGKWDHPTFTYTTHYCSIVAALEEAGTIDTDKVAEVFGSGLRFDSPCGTAQMVSRPDLGNDRTTDIVIDCTIKQIVGGEPVPLATIPVDEVASDYFLKYIGVAD